MRVLNYLISFNFSWDEEREQWYYFNFESGQTSWIHPLDNIYKEVVSKYRQGEISLQGK